MTLIRRSVYIIVLQGWCSKTEGHHRQIHVADKHTPKNTAKRGRQRTRKEKRKLAKGAEHRITAVHGVARHIGPVKRSEALWCCFKRLLRIGWTNEVAPFGHSVGVGRERENLDRSAAHILNQTFKERLSCARTKVPSARRTRRPN